MQIKTLPFDMVNTKENFNKTQKLNIAFTDTIPHFHLKYTNLGDACVNGDR